MPKNNDYTLADFERAYRDAYPDWSRGDIRRAAKADFRLYSEAKPHLILDIHNLHDPTCGEAEFNLRAEANQSAAARRVEVAA